MNTNSEQDAFRGISKDRSQAFGRQCRIIFDDLCLRPSRCEETHNKIYSKPCSPDNWLPGENRWVGMNICFPVHRKCNNFLGS